MRRALALLPLVLLAAACAPSPPKTLDLSSAAWERKVHGILADYNAALKSNEAYLAREQTRLIREKDEAGLLSLMIGYARHTQKLSVEATRDVDAAGEPPPKARRMMAILRRLMKMRTNAGRSLASALARSDLKRVDRLIAKEAKELPPVQKALVEEVRRVAPGAMETLPGNPKKAEAERGLL